MQVDPLGEGCGGAQHSPWQPPGPLATTVPPRGMQVPAATQTPLLIAQGVPLEEPPVPPPASPEVPLPPAPAPASPEAPPPAPPLVLPPIPTPALVPAPGSPPLDESPPAPPTRASVPAVPAVRAGEEPASLDGWLL
ncbi:MAG TPA: hypothetical protein VJN18_06405 [Polyangiaceae bacterium]|nr:hypothetical protein [Polyangiaceae bacterium]